MKAIASLSLLFFGCCAFTTGGPSPDPTKKQPPADKPPKLVDLKLTLPEGWGAKFSDVLKTWKISQGLAPFVTVGWALAEDYPKNLDDYVEKLKKNGDHFGGFYHWTTVTEKEKLPDGLYVVGKVKHGTADKETERIGFSIIRDLGGKKVIFESFSTYYDDAKLLNEAMGICKSAKFLEVAKEMQKLLGTWTVVEARLGGSALKFDKPLPRFRIAQEKIILIQDGKEQEKIILIQDGKEQKDVELTYKADPTREPNAIDLVLKHDKGTRIWKAIYKFEGNRMKVAFRFPLKWALGSPPSFFDEPPERLGSFDAKNALVMLHILERVKE
jgi:uncharacterized protein (TIGR03067 family)